MSVRPRQVPTRLKRQIDCVLDTMLRYCSRGTARRRVMGSVLGGVLIFVVGTFYMCPPKRRINASPKRVEKRWNNETECARWKTSNAVLARSSPKIKLNPEKFLLPLLYNGPTNQLWGLRQAAYLAVILNRTLVLPLFRKHVTDDSGPYETIDPNYRFQLEPLANLLSITNLDNYKRHCDRKADAIFSAVQLRKWSITTLEQGEKDLDVKLLQRKENGDVSLSNPLRSDVKYVSPVERQASRQSIKKQYASDAKCVLYALPFRELIKDVRKSSWKDDYESHYGQLGTALHKVPDWAIFQAIHLNTPIAKYVQEIVKMFLNSAIGENLYMAIHWRYDQEDFHTFMCDKPDGVGNPNQAKMCSQIAQVTPENLGQAVAKHVEHVGKNLKKQISKVYVATPTTFSAREFAGQLADTLKRFRIKVLTQHDMQAFVRRSQLFDQCDFLEKNFNEFLSLAEMELCSRSTVFIRSAYSSWTDTVNANRVLWHAKTAMRRFDRAAVKLVVPDE